MQRKTVIGLIGRIGSGKTIVAQHLTDGYGAAVYRFSDVLKDMLDRVHKPNTRENLQTLGLALRKAFNEEGILAETLRLDIINEKRNVVVIDGIRYEDEYRMVKDLGGVVAYVTAPPEERYKRTVKRGTRGEKHISFEEFKASEEKETERRIDKLGSKADYVLENTGTVAELTGRVDEIMRSLNHQSN